jgi:hypothetical protein
MTPNEQSQHLKRTIAPYAGQIIILLLVTLYFLFVSLKTHEWGFILTVPVMWLLFSPLVYFGLKYQVFWTETEVCQKTSGGSDVCIKYGEITRVTSEVSKPGELLAASRPFRRIVIYVERPQDTGKFIDVSLKHFAAEDICRLMHAIHDRRPDLTLPKNWC